MVILIRISIIYARTVHRANEERADPLSYALWICVRQSANGSLCESLVHDCLKRLPRVREAGPGRRKQTPGRG